MRFRFSYSLFRHWKIFSHIRGAFIGKASIIGCYRQKESPPARRATTAIGRRTTPLAYDTSPIFAIASTTARQATHARRRRRMADGIILSRYHVTLLEWYFRRT